MASNSDNKSPLPRKTRLAGTLITQGSHRFYSATVPIELLASTCTVVPRADDPEEGFQRLLDEHRAKDIASYIDNGGVIPNTIVLSAQEDAEFEYSSRSTVLSFRPIPNAFLILDGQHRVYGFRLSNSKLRVPVVIFNGLSRSEEARLFVDINTKQQRVPNELLLDIKKLALLESDEENFTRELFDLLNTDPQSCMRGLMSASERKPGKISRVTFRRAIRPILSRVIGNSPESIYDALNAYLTAFRSRLIDAEMSDSEMTKASSFPAILMLFVDASAKVRDRFNADFTVNHFNSVLDPVFSDLRPSNYQRLAKGHKKLYEYLESKLNSESLRF